MTRRSGVGVNVGSGVLVGVGVLVSVGVLVIAGVFVDVGVSRAIAVRVPESAFWSASCEGEQEANKKARSMRKMNERFMEIPFQQVLSNYGIIPKKTQSN